MQGFFLPAPPLNFPSTKSPYNCLHLEKFRARFAMDPVLRKFTGGGPVKRTTLYFEQIYIFNKPGVARAVLLTPPLLIN